MFETQKQTFTINNSSKEELLKIVKDIEIAYAKKSLIEDSLIHKYNEEKSQNYSKIELEYTPLNKVTRIWNKAESRKKCYPSYEDLYTHEWINGVGDDIWFPYRFNLLKNAQRQWCLIHEGEKAVDFALSKNIISSCILGAKAYDQEFIKRAIDILELNMISGAIYLADEDEQGLKKAKVFQEIAYQKGFILLILPIKFILPSAQKGDDFVEYLEANQDKSSSELVEDIEAKIKYFGYALVSDYISCKPQLIEQDKQLQAIEKAKEILLNENDEIQQIFKLEQIRKQTKFSESTWQNKIIKILRRETRGDRLKLDLKYYAQEEDPIQQLKLKQIICGRYSLSSSDFHSLSLKFHKQEEKPAKTIFSFDEFMNMGNQQQDWLIPSFLPTGSMLLLCAAPKCGKSLLASDLAYCVLTGGQFLSQKVKQGKVLYVCSDEPPRDFVRRIQSRGFDLIPNINEKLKILTSLDLYNLKELEKQLEDFRPDLVIIDSLTSISLDTGVSENSAEYAKQAYKLKDLFAKYNSASILIHHQNKNSEARGLGRVAGSMRITAVPWGIAQLSGGAQELSNGSNTLVEDANVRWLDLQPREGEAAKYELSINPRDTWSEKSIFQFHCDCDDPKKEKSKQGDLVIEVLSEGKKLEYSEINEQLNLGINLYKVLDYLCDRGLISRARSKMNPRRWVYFIKNNSQINTSKGGGYKKISPPPLDNQQPDSIKPEKADSDKRKTKTKIEEQMFTNRNNSENLPLISDLDYCKETSTIDNEKRTALEILDTTLEYMGIKRENKNKYIKEYTNGKSFWELTTEQLNTLLETLWTQIDEQIEGEIDNGTS